MKAIGAIQESRVAVWITMLAIFGSSTVSAGINKWTSLRPYGGSIKALAIDPQNPCTLYAGTLVSGVFKSTDAGASWDAVECWPVLCSPRSAGDRSAKHERAVRAGG